jgi:peptide/nickel transport system ATP-binding protein
MRVEEALEAIGLPRALTSAKPVQLSGGQRQRVALARATIIAPAVLLCDEPTSSLDASLAASVLNLIRQMRSELGMAVIFVTHDISVARLMGDRVGVMREGELVEIGATEDVLSRPQHPYTRTLLSAVPEIDLATGEAA